MRGRILPHTLICASAYGASGLHFNPASDCRVSFSNVPEHDDRLLFVYCISIYSVQENRPLLYSKRGISGLRPTDVLLCGGVSEDLSIEAVSVLASQNCFKVSGLSEDSSIEAASVLPSRPSVCLSLRSHFSPVWGTDAADDQAMGSLALEFFLVPVFLFFGVGLFFFRLPYSSVLSIFPYFCSAGVPGLFHLGYVYRIIATAKTLGNQLMGDSHSYQLNEG